ncbi:hypothetical protein BCON_0041g00330 [Botryotinia convoluta]|uniref:Uncharacterized protein n=1 Tax=Botryotinia convoluta TaxID=54673 RepID=A0A4Z1IE94_9HELO|nr:hypothetical protein BCON_0041g00330 [Botryotinia convoluta]
MQIHSISHHQKHKGRVKPPPSCREGGPLLLELPMGTNNNDTNTATQPTLTVDQSSVIGEDRPLLFAFKLGQNNNNSAADYVITNVIYDTLDLRNFGLELKAVGNEDEKDISITTSSANDDENDGSLSEAKKHSPNNEPLQFLERR